MRGVSGGPGSARYCFASVRNVGVGVVMGWWQVNADTLAGSRFVLSPLAETFASLKLLNAGTAQHPGEHSWLRAHLPAYRRRLADDPVTALLVRSGLGREWIADFLTP